MDPHLFDLLWEVYQDVDGKQPYNIVSSYREPKTNAMLKAEPPLQLAFGPYVWAGTPSGIPETPPNGRSAPIVIATAMVPGPVVNGSVSGKNASCMGSSSLFGAASRS